MLKFTSKLVFILSFLAATTAFAQVPEIPPLNPIVGGTSTTSSSYYGVVRLYLHLPGNYVTFCSGTLIDRYHVVTAAHCMDGKTSAEVQFYTSSSSSYSTSISASEWVIHPDWANRTSTYLPGDLAIVKLSSAAPSYITPIPVLPPSKAISSADDGSLDLTFVGFGYTSGGATGTGGTKRMVSNIRLRRHCDSTGSCVINDPRKYRIEGRTLFFYEQNTSGNIAGICSGDSGGPSLIYRGGTLYVASVNSYVNGDGSGGAGCDLYGVATKLDKYYTFITNYTGTSGTTSENCTNGTDDDGDGKADCADPDCAANPACSGGSGGDACADAATIQCGDTINGNTLNGSSIYGMSACSFWGPDEGPEEAYKITAPAGLTVKIDVALLSPSDDLDIFLMDEVNGTCNSSSCVEKSTNWGGSDESLTYTADGGTYYLLVDTDDTPGPYTLTVTCYESGGSTAGGGVTEQEICNDGIDNDGDGAADCVDSDCFTDAACQTTYPPESCTNGVDDDGDGAVDCADVDCYNVAYCSAAEDCTNHLDDDGDGLVDCDDADCYSLSACSSASSREICDNGVDDDGDMIVDCNDPDCASFGACAPAVENCFNGTDDDGDGAIDCADSDCYTASHCTTLTFTEICDNGIDDDGDGVIDCADADCFSNSACASSGSSGGGCSVNSRNNGTVPFVLMAFAFLMMLNGFRRRKK